MANPQETEPLLQGESSNSPVESVDAERERALNEFKRKLLEHREWDAKLKDLRMSIKGLQNDYERTEDVSFDC